MKKRLVALFMAGVLSVSILAGCGGTEASPKDESVNETETVVADMTSESGSDDAQNADIQISNSAEPTEEVTPTEDANPTEEVNPTETTFSDDPIVAKFQALEAPFAIGREAEIIDSIEQYDNSKVISVSDKTDAGIIFTTENGNSYYYDSLFEFSVGRWCDSSNPGAAIWLTDGGFVDN